MSEMLRDLTVEEARARMLASAIGTGVETVSLAGASGRVLAETVTAQRDQPPFDASAMDGWAVRGAGGAFRIVGESAAGRGYRAPLQDGEAARIFTGAPVPQGAERIVIQEEASREGEQVTTAPSDDAPRHIRPRGGDFQAGETLLEPGRRLDPWRLSLAAAAGREGLRVARRPQVRVLSTGEELVAPGWRPGPAQIFESGSPALAALIERWGGEAVVLERVGDDAEAIARSTAAAGGELIVTMGGASVGDHDLVKPALARLGLVLRVETVRLRPGKPTWFGILDDGRRVLGLPGNPASALVCAELFLKPLLLAMQGADPALKLLSARLDGAAPANGPREHWARARLQSRDGGLWAQPMTDQDSSLVSVFARADALIRCPSRMPASDTGALVEVLPLERL
ncbi:MAG: molybdopterin molybdotransferase MoeA [Caulobacteraceae bacterium]|nr:molybdopterin molybdotransferase MoeA [Caulobacteraceae bacterium]